MLVILYGAISKMGCRDYFEQNGFRVVEKLNYAVSPQLTAQAGARNYVSYEEFMENTDSLFRYEVGGIQVGFKQSQIEEAVYGDEKYLLTLSTKDIAFLERIKQVYGDKVCLIYTYIDTDALRRIAESKYDAAEVQIRLEIGKGVKEGYLSHSHIFDYVVVYGGDDSVMNEKALAQQLDGILSKMTEAPLLQLEYGDVCIVSVEEDKSIETYLHTQLTDRMVSVFDKTQLPQGEGYLAATTEAVRNAKIFIPVLSKKVFEEYQDEMTRLLTVAYDNGCIVIPLMVQNHLLGRQSPIAEALRNDCFRIGLYKYDHKNILDVLVDDLEHLLEYELGLRDSALHVERYCALGMFEEALYWQKTYTEWCWRTDEYYIKSTLLKYCFLLFKGEIGASIIKEFQIAMDMGRPLEALCAIRNFLFQECWEYILTDTDWDRILLCFTENELEPTEVKTLIRDLLALYYGDEDAISEDTERIFAHYCLVSEKTKNIESITVVADELAGPEACIAQCGQNAIELFESILEGAGNKLSRLDLITGYQRILDYCGVLGIKGDVAKKCVERIDELKTVNDEIDGDYSEINTALRVYLGETLPQFGEYDVFLSYKSEDVSMATTIYNFLTQHGKMVFFSKETLPRLGESEYKDAIFEAIDHSKHMIVVGSDPDYLKTPWVKREWDAFDNELLEERKDGNLLLVLSDSAATDKGKLPTQLRKYEIVRMSEFRERLLSYLR